VEIVFIIIVLFATGAAGWIWQGLRDACAYIRRLVAEHPQGYKIACALALLCGIAGGYIEYKKKGIDPAGGRTETLADVQAWYAEHLRQLEGLPEGAIKETLQAVLFKEYTDRMMRAMGAAG